MTTRQKLQSLLDTQAYTLTAEARQQITDAIAALDAAEERDRLWQAEIDRLSAELQAKTESPS